MELRKLDLMKYHMDRAKETAQEAELALTNNKLRLAENRIYYAIFYIVHALSILENFSTAKHVTLKGWFNKEFETPNNQFISLQTLTEHMWGTWEGKKTLQQHIQSIFSSRRNGKWLKN